MPAVYRQNDAKLHMINLVHNAVMKLSEAGFVVGVVKISDRPRIIIDRPLDGSPKTITAVHWVWNYENCLVGCLLPAVASGEDLQL